jgi:SHS2 domain-containing protein
LDFLLVDWLNELLFAFDSQKLLLCRFRVVCDENRLDATAEGEVFDAKRHHLEHEVKAITYHGLKVERSGNVWLAEVIVDI